MLGVYITVYQYTILNISRLFMLDAAMMGLLIGIQHFGMAIPPFFLGVLGARIGKKRVIIISLLLMISGMLLAGLTQSFGLLIAAIFLIGAGFSVTEATMSAVLADEYPEESTRHLNFSQMAFSVGALCGPFIAQDLIGAGIYFKDLFLYCAAVFLLLGAAFLFTRHNNDKGAPYLQPEGGHYRAFFGSRMLVLLGISIFLYVGIENTIANYTDSYYELMLGAPELSATALALFWGAMIPSRFLAGVLKVNAKKVFILLVALVAVTVSAAMFVADTMMKVVLFAASGFFCGPLWPLLMDVVAKRNAGASGPAMNMMMSFSALGGAALPFVSGFAVESAGVTSAYILCVAAAVLMLGIYAFSVKRGKKDFGSLEDR